MCHKMKMLRRQASPWTITFMVLILLVSQGQMWPQNFASPNMRPPTIGDNRGSSDLSDVPPPSSPRPAAPTPRRPPRPSSFPSPGPSPRPSPGPSPRPSPGQRDGGLAEPWARAGEAARRTMALTARAVASHHGDKLLDRGPTPAMSTSTTTNRTAKYGRSQDDSMSGIMGLVATAMRVTQLGEARRPPGPGGDVGLSRPQWNQNGRPESRIREKPDDFGPNKAEPPLRGNSPQPIVTFGKRGDRPSKPGRPPDSTQIVFPGQPVPPPRFVPTPQCAGNGRTFCEATADYPADHLARLLDSELATRFGTLFGADEVDATNITQRFDSPSEDETLCQSVERVIYPTAGQTRDDEWRFIVNQEKFLQGVRIEMCMNEDSACMFGDSFPFGYQSFCKQKFIYRKLVSLKEDGSTTTDDFKLPACCSCHVRTDLTSMRMAASDVTPVARPKS